MIVPSDKDYKETKLIKQGKAFINPDFKSLAEWIDKSYSVQVLNIYYDIVKGVHNKEFPRVNIIFENKEEELKFEDGLWNFNPGKQKIIAKKFDELVNHNTKEPSNTFWSFMKTKRSKYDTQELLVIFDSFKPIARDEANERIPKSEVDAFKTSLDNPNIWEISRFASSATFFFYTQEQSDAAKANNYVQELSDKYFELLKKYDEFNYFDRQEFSVSVDSKENFDNKYQGNWYYYYK